MDIFEKRDIKPMLIAEERQPFDDPNYIFELKLDGLRCIAYIDRNEVDLRNKRNDKVLFRYPELADIYEQINCESIILDGELFVMKDGKTDFFEMQRRSLMSDFFKIRLSLQKLPISFCAFDILYRDGKLLIDMPLVQRKQILQNSIQENDRLSISRYVESNGIKLFELTKSKQLEGIVAKRKESKYYFDKRTKDWIKIKNLEDDDFIVCGYLEKEANVNSIILAQFSSNRNLIYKGHVTLGISNTDMNTIKSHPKINSPLFDGQKNAVWIEPILVCTVKYMEKTVNGGLRQPVFKGLRNDKTAEECIEKI